MLVTSRFWKNGAKIAATVCAAFLLCSAASSVASAQAATGQMSMGPAQAVHLPLLRLQRAGNEQKRNFIAAMSNLDEHHIAAPLKVAKVPFAQRSTQPVQPRPQAISKGGVTITSKIDVTAKALLAYDYVSPIAEASAAKAGKTILVTFNWGAVFSKDGGKTFSRLDPFALFGKPENSPGFCCDQLAMYVPKHDLLVWLMQGDADTKDKLGNTIRVLVAHGPDIAKHVFHFYDFTPKTVGHGTGEWFDFPDLAYTDNNLFMAFNRFNFDDPQKALGSTVIRIPLDKLSSYGGFKYQYFNTSVDNGEFSVRFTQGADKTMFWASTPATNELLVRQWPDTAAQPGPARPVSIEPYVPATPKSVAGSEGPNGKPWLDRADSRITAGWATAKTIGFAWTSGKIDKADKAGATFPYPHIRVAILDRAAVEAGGTDPLKPIAQPNIWNKDNALAYPSAAPNKNGDVGFSLFYGGPHAYPSAAVGVLKDVDGTWTPTLTMLAAGSMTPRCVKMDGVDNACGKWGDYMTVRADPNNPDGWYVAAHTEIDHGGKEPPKVRVTLGSFAAK